MRYEIISVEPKTDKNNKGYFRLKVKDNSSSEIWLTDFSQGQYNVGEQWEFEIDTNKSGDKVFHNVKSKKLINSIDIVGKIDPIIIPTGNGLKTYDKDPVGLAVDVFCMLVPTALSKVDEVEYEIVMKSAINAVKQAQEAFK